MAVKSEENKIETTLDRAKRISTYVEELISTIGEHPECELKEIWLRNTPALKAEFIKDIQSIANSTIPVETEKYVVVGASETKRKIVGCNHSEFDDADIRQLLHSNLDSTPNFEIFRLKSSENIDFVVFVILHQTKRPFIAKTNIYDDKGKCHLAEGQIWIKSNGSSGKQLLKSKAEILNLIDIESLVSKEVENRINKLKAEIRLEERTRITSSGFKAIPSLTSTDEEFESFVKQITASNEKSRFNVLLQDLRDECVEIWESKSDKDEVLSVEEIIEVKETIFLPAMRRLALLGILTIKYEVSESWFNKIADLLIDIFNLSEKLSSIIPFEIRQQKAENLETHSNNYIPALESIMVSNILIGYEIKKKKSIQYSSKLFPRLVNIKTESPYTSDEVKIFYLFYNGYSDFYHQTVNKRFDLLIQERYGDAGNISKFFGSEKSLTKTLFQVNCIIDWLSFLSFENLTNESHLAKYFDKEYPTINTSFYPFYFRELLKNLEPLVKEIWGDLQSKENNYFLLDSGLAQEFSKISVDKRKEVFARFLIEAEKLHAKNMIAQQRFSFGTYWSEEINSIIHSIKNGE